MGNSTQPGLSVDGSMKVWTKARLARKRILMGMSNYRYVQNSDKTWLRLRRQQDIIVPVQSCSGGNEAPQDLLVTGSLNPVKLSSDSDSQIQFTGLVKQGAVWRSPSSSLFANYTASEGFSRHWDACSPTPHLVTLVTHQLMTYDDPDSLCLKAARATQLGITGLNIFDVHDTPGRV